MCVFVGVHAILFMRSWRACECLSCYPLHLKWEGLVNSQYEYMYKIPYLAHITCSFKVICL